MKNHKIMIKPMQRFWRLLSQYKSEIRQIYTYAILIGIVNLTLPLGIQAIINYIQTGELTTSWIILVAFVLLGIAITGTLQVFQIRTVENIQQDLFAKSAFEFGYRIPKITFLQLDKIHAPELANRFFDTLTIQKGLPKILIDFSLAAFQIIFGLLLLTVYSSYFIILGIVLLTILWLIFKITGPRGLATSLNESKYKYKLVHWLEEVARLNRSFKLTSYSTFHLTKTDGIVQGYLKFREKHFQVLINQFKLFIGFKVFVAAGLLILGGYLVFDERMNIGQFVAAEIIILLIINSVEKILRIIDTIYDVLTALEKIGYVTDLELDKDSGFNDLDESRGISIKVRDLKFGFPNENRKVLDGLSFETPNGARAILKGKSGSGKTLLLQILSGIHPVEEGGVYINGSPLVSYKTESLHQSLGISFPVNQIFEGTFKENIIMGREIKPEKLSQTLSLLKLDDYFDNQYQGINSMVDSGGRRLPRSIIQKILVARIIVSEPKLLLLEDPLQFIEESEKKRIIDYLMSPERKWTVIVISDFYYWEEKSTQTIQLSQEQN